MTKHPRALALLVVLAGLLVPASPAFAVGTPTITTPATTPGYTTNQVDLVWSTVLDATNGYEVYRGTALDCLDATLISTPLFMATSFSETPPDGSYCYYVTADDGVATAASATVRIFRDSVNPAGSWSSPSSGQNLTGTGSLDLTVVPSDATSGVASVAFEIETAPGSGIYTPLGTSTSAPYQQSWPFNLSTTEGTYHLHATIADKAGNTTLLTRTVIVDNTGPTGDITVANAVRGTVALPAVATDGPDGTGVKTMQWFRNSIATGTVQIGIGVLGGSGSVNWDTAAVPDGLYQLSLNFLDNANNSSTSVHTPDVLVDNTQPTGTLSPATNGAVGASTTLTATVTDGTGSGIDQVVFSFSPAGMNAYTTLGVDSTGPTYQYSWDTTGVVEGPYDLRATVVDAVGNTRVITSNAVNVDRTAPTATLSAPASGANVRGATVAVTPAVSDAGSGIAHVVTEYAPNSSGVYTTIADIAAPGPYGASWDTTALADGLYSVRTRVFDKAGNSASDTKTNVRIDNTAPSVTRTAPAANAVLRGTISFGGSASDAGSGLASDSFVLSQSGVDKATVAAIAGSGNAVSATLDTILSATLDGLYDVRLEAHDSAGNVAVTSLVAVRIDNTNPTGSLTTAPTAGSTVVGAVPLASADAADSGGSGVQSVAFEFAPTLSNAWSPVAAADTIAPYSVNWPTGTLCDGTWDLRITVTDGASNTFSTAPIVGVTTNNGSCTAAIDRKSVV